MRCLVVVPAYNEEGNIAATVADIRANAPAAAVLVVNDGSRDGTASAARQAGATVLSLPYNLGIGGAVQAGLKYALRENFDAVIQVDGDGQHPAAEIARLLEPIARGEADAVIGSRFLPGSTGYRSSAQRRMGIRVFRLVNRILLRQRFTDATSGFRAYGRATLPLLASHYPRDFPEPEAIVLLVHRGFRVVEAPVSMRPRLEGRSSIRGLKVVHYMAKVTFSLLIEMLRRKGDAD